jgi:hypothetical protein
MDTTAVALALLLGSMTLTGCPLARPREVDCGGAVTSAENVDRALAPFASLDLKTATDAEIKAWAAAVTAARAAVPSSDTMVHDDVKKLAVDFKTALDGLESAVGDRAKAKSAEADARVVKAQADLASARKQISEKCARRP